MKQKKRSLGYAFSMVDGRDRALPCLYYNISTKILLQVLFRVQLVPPLVLAL
jgi:hypothetical protein